MIRKIYRYFIAMFASLPLRQAAAATVKTVMLSVSYCGGRGDVAADEEQPVGFLDVGLVALLERD